MNSYINLQNRNEMWSVVYFKFQFSATRECKECLKEGEERKKKCLIAEIEPDTRNQDLEDLNNWTPDPKGKNKNVY